MIFRSEKYHKAGRGVGVGWGAGMYLKRLHAIRESSHGKTPLRHRAVLFGLLQQQLKKNTFTKYCIQVIELINCTGAQHPSSKIRGLVRNQMIYIPGKVRRSREKSFPGSWRVPGWAEPPRHIYTLGIHILYTHLYRYQLGIFQLYFDHHQGR
jgi:hypothetical protein